MSTHVIALTCGDPSGIGPEIAIKAWEALGRDVPFVWLGDPRHLPNGVNISRVAAPSDALTADGFPVLPIPFATEADPGHPDPRNAPGVLRVLETAIDWVTAGAASAICTAPISKKELVENAGFSFPGHTEFLAAAAGNVPVAMMLVAEELRVVPATIHIPLADVPVMLTPEGLEQTIKTTHDALVRDFGITSPRLALAGLNPHAGEGGQIGSEEVLWINTLVEQLCEQGLRLTGPLPADTMFHAAARARYDAAIAMYHDQALIPIKTLAFDRGVNVTLGLPFIRTSPDHGTAFNIAGQGVADPTSLIEALKLAQTLAKARAA